MSWSTKRFVVFLAFIHLFRSYIRVCFQVVAFVKEHIWHKILLMRLELTRVCCLNRFQLVIGLYKRHSSLFLRVCLPKPALPLIALWYLICVCRCVWVYVCWSGFGFHLELFFLCVCVSMCPEIFLCSSVWNLQVIIFTNNLCVCVCIYISMHVCVHLCVCMIHVLFNFCLNLSIIFSPLFEVACSR